MIKPINHSQEQQSFRAVSCRDKRAVKLITSVKKQHLDYLEKTIDEQIENPVDIIFHSKYGMFLTATLSSIYGIKDFKAQFSQKPIIESRISFIKRVVEQANEYKAQIAAAAKSNPEAFLCGRDPEKTELIKQLIEANK